MNQLIEKIRKKYKCKSQKITYIDGGKTIQFIYDEGRNDSPFCSISCGKNKYVSFDINSSEEHWSGGSFTKQDLLDFIKIGEELAKESE